MIHCILCIPFVCKTKNSFSFLIFNIQPADIVRYDPVLLFKILFRTHKTITINQKKNVFLCFFSYSLLWFQPNTKHIINFSCNFFLITFYNWKIYVFSWFILYIYVCGKIFPEILLNSFDQINVFSYQKQLIERTVLVLM